MSLALLDRASVGRPITRVGVSLFPLYVHQAPGAEIVTGPDAPVVIEELPEADVPTLLVTSSSPAPVLLVDGETVKGGQQQRTLNVSVLVPAHGTAHIPVSCVEAGRWSGERTFSRGRSFVPRRVRRVKQVTVADALADDGSRYSDQGQVWDTVAAELLHHEAYSATSALDAAESVLERSPRFDGSVRDLTERGPLPGQCGVVLAHGSRVVGAEVFGAPDLLAAHWEAIVRAALLDAPTQVHGKPSAGRALRFVHRIGTCAAVDEPGVGLGREHHVRTERYVAQGLSLDDRLVHGSAFALAA